MNTPEPTPAISRILIVENEPGTVASLRYDLRQAFKDAGIGDVEISNAGTVIDGQAALDEAYDQKRIFDVVILDFKLPHARNSLAEESDFSLGFVKDLCPETLVIHVTAYVDDLDFRRVRPAPGTPEAANRLYFEKVEGWINRVVTASLQHVQSIRARFHTGRIRARFKELFQGNDDETAERRVQRHRSCGQGDRERSLDVAELCADASQHWEYLEPGLQKTLKEALGYATDGKRHFVGVMPSLSPTSSNKPEGQV